MISLSQAASADSIRTVVRQVFAASEYDWKSGVRTSVWSRVGLWFLRGVAWLERLHDTHPVGYWVLIGLMVAMLVAILVHFGYVLVRVLRPVTTGRTAGPAPAPPPRDARWHLAEARRLAAAGRYADALGHRYLALMLDLDRRGVVRFHPSKTPAEYLGEVAVDSAARSGFADLVWSLYRHLFGGAPCAAEEWAAFDLAAASLSSHVAPA